MKEPFLLIDAKKDVTRIESQGSIPDTLALLANAINKLYFFIKSKDELMAKAFKEILTELFTEEDSPLWNESEGEGAGAIYEIKK